MIIHNVANFVRVWELLSVIGLPDILKVKYLPLIVVILIINITYKTCTKD